MKKVKLLSAAILAISLLLGTALCYAQASFSDVKSTNWAYPYISNLVERGGIDGYPDGTFKPNGTITNAEFIKTIVGSLTSEKIEKSSSHWASGYIVFAQEKGLLERSELAPSEYNRNIKRQAMATIISRAAEIMLGEEMAVPDGVKSRITDYSDISTEYRVAIEKVYGNGIITGYPDGSFGSDKTATRAEAAAMIVRLIDKTKRVEPKEESPADALPDFVETYNNGEIDKTPQKYATLSDLGIAKVDIYDKNKIRVFSSSEQSIAVYVGNDCCAQSISVDCDYWLVDGYKMYLFTSEKDPKGQALRILKGDTIYLIKGVL